MHGVNIKVGVGTHAHRSTRSTKINPKIVMDEDLVQTGVMDGKFVKNFVTDAKIHPKVVMDLSILPNWWMEQFATHQSKPWLLIGTPCRDPFLATHSTWNDTL